MAQELVWARVGDHNAAVSRNQATAKGYEVLDEDPRDAHGEVRRPTRASGRPIKKKTSVAKQAAARKAAAKVAAAKEKAQAEKVSADPASNSKENPR